MFVMAMSDGRVHNANFHPLHVQDRSTKQGLAPGVVSVLDVDVKKFMQPVFANVTQLANS